MFLSVIVSGAKLSFPPKNWIWISLSVDLMWIWTILFEHNLGQQFWRYLCFPIQVLAYSNSEAISRWPPSWLALKLLERKMYLRINHISIFLLNLWTLFGMWTSFYILWKWNISSSTVWLQKLRVFGMVGKASNFHTCFSQLWFKKKQH